MFLGANEDAQKLAIQKMIDGDIQRDLTKTQRNLQRDRGKYASAMMQVQQMPEGTKKAEAMNLLQSMKANIDKRQAMWDEAAADYNSSARTIRAVSFNAVQPPLLGGMGNLGAAQLVVYAIIAAGVGVTLLVITDLVRGIFGYEMKFLEMLKALRDIIVTMPKLLISGSSAIATIAFTFVGVSAAYLVYDTWNKAGRPFPGKQKRKGARA